MITIRELAASIDADVEWVRARVRNALGENDYTDDFEIDASTAKMIKDAWIERSQATARQSAENSQEQKPGADVPADDGSPAAGDGRNQRKNEMPLEAAANYLRKKGLQYSVVIGDTSCGKSAFYHICGDALGWPSDYDYDGTTGRQACLHFIPNDGGQSHGCLVDLAGEDFRAFFRTARGVDPVDFDIVFATQRVVTLITEAASETTEPQPSKEESNARQKPDYDEIAQLKASELEALEFIIHRAERLYVFLNPGAIPLHAIRAKVVTAARIILARIGIAKNIPVMFVVNQADACSLNDRGGENAAPSLDMNKMYQIGSCDIRATEGHRCISGADNRQIATSFGEFPSCIERANVLGTPFNEERAIDADGIPNRWRYAILLYPPHRYVKRRASEGMINDAAHRDAWKKLRALADAFSGNAEYKKSDDKFVGFLKDHVFSFSNEFGDGKLFKNAIAYFALAASLAVFCAFVAENNIPSYEYNTSAASASQYAVRATDVSTAESGSIPAAFANVPDAKLPGYLKGLMFDYESDLEELWRPRLIDVDSDNPTEVRRTKEARAATSGCAQLSLPTPRWSMELTSAINALYTSAHTYPELIMRADTENATKAAIAKGREIESCQAALAGFLKLRYEIANFDFSARNDMAEFKATAANLMSAYERIHAMDKQLLGYYSFNDNYRREMPLLSRLARERTKSESAVRFDLADRRSVSDDPLLSLDPCHGLFAFGLVTRPITAQGKTDEKCDEWLYRLGWLEKSADGEGLVETIDARRAFDGMSSSERDTLCNNDRTLCARTGSWIWVGIASLLAAAFVAIALLIVKHRTTVVARSASNVLTSVSHRAKRLLRHG